MFSTSDTVKMLEQVPDHALASLMQSNDGMAPQYLVASELQRRQQMRQQQQQVMAKAQQAESPPTVAQGLLQGGMKAPLQSGVAPQGINGLPNAMPPAQSSLMAPKPPGQNAAPAPSGGIAAAPHFAKGGKVHLAKGGIGAIPGIPDLPKFKPQQMPLEAPPTISVPNPIQPVDTSMKRGGRLHAAVGASVDADEAPLVGDSSAGVSFPTIEQFRSGFKRFMGVPEEQPVVATPAPVAPPNLASAPAPIGPALLANLKAGSTQPVPGAAPPVTPSTDDGGDDEDQKPALKGFGAYKPTPIQAKDISGFMDQAKSLYGDDPTVKLAAKLADLEDKAHENGKEAAGMALLRAGAAMAQNKSNQPLVALASGVQEGANEYGQQLKENRAQQLALLGAQAQLGSAQSQRQAALAGFGQHLQGQDVSIQEANQKALHDAAALQEQAALRKTTLAQTAEFKNAELDLKRQMYGLGNSADEQDPRAGYHQMLANYEAPAPSPRSPSFASDIAAAKKYNPDFNVANYQEAQRAKVAFGSGKQGDTIRSFNTGLSHLDTLSDLTDALNNGQVPIINRVANTAATQIGLTAAPTNFNAAKEVVGNEIVKAITGAGGGVADREKAQQTLGAANTPEQLKGVIETYKNLMAGQLNGLKRQYESSTFGAKDFATKLSPQAQKYIMGEQAAITTAAPVPSNVVHWDELK